MSYRSHTEDTEVIQKSYRSHTEVIRKSQETYIYKSHLIVILYVVFFLKLESLYVPSSKTSDTYQTHAMEIN